ncbi:hypothetical protein Taro_029854 [Colocasia esculenta]|uniref:Uncharacterized protein n=1 Tax=Colocasia esculenta TaxID=4460 RepID=A0A843VKW3_COLES|nr:hypothetical protein [Colocasia esculenta]
MSTIKVCIVFLDTLTPEFELYVWLRERRQGAATRVWCWFVSTVLDPIEVERQLDFSSVAMRLRGRLVLFVQDLKGYVGTKTPKAVGERSDDLIEYGKEGMVERSWRLR